MGMRFPGQTAWALVAGAYVYALAPRGMGWLTPQNVCYRAKFGRSASNGVDIRIGGT